MFGEYLFKSSDSAKTYFSAFANISYVHARYGKTIEEQAYSGNKVELVPPFSVRTGIKLYSGKFTASYLFSYVHEHFSDGTNAVYDPNAVVGLIPSYYVMDIGGTYKLNKFLTFKAGVNNLTNNMYFTRRSTGYPGPGIIPSDGINFYVTVDVNL